MAYSFSGGIHPEYHKQLTAGKPIETLKAPAKVVLPMSMHIGAPCQPLVAVGDKVDLGQKIADSPAAVSAPVHATISGTVTSIAPMPHPTGAKVLSIVIENDFEDRLSPAIHPVDWEGMTTDEICAVIREAGIVGHGGAAFPTHIKIKSAIGKVDTMIINAAECEPYITSDHRLLLERPEEMMGGVAILLKACGLKTCTLAVEKNKDNAFAGIRKLMEGRNDITLLPMNVKYPQGAEKQLIFTVTGREVPSGGLPADAGCIVFNADTVGAVYRAFHQGMPMIRRIVTVSGSAIGNPKNLEARIGTPLADLVEACGGFKEEPKKMLMGGPMMGNPQYTLDAPVIKGTNAFLGFSGSEDKTVEHPTCIRCGKCVSVCPMHLTPVYLNMYATAGRLDEAAELGMLDCIECGCCSYECPGRLYLVQTFRAAKQRIQEERRKKQAEEKARKEAETAKKAKEEGNAK